MKAIKIKMAANEPVVADIVVSFTFVPDAYATLTGLTEKLQLSTKGETIRVALIVLNSLIRDAEKSGNDFVINNGDGSVIKYPITK